MFIETSVPRQLGDKAWFVSQGFPPVSRSGRCVRFWYNMHGKTVDTLSVIIRTPGRGMSFVVDDFKVFM